MNESFYTYLHGPRTFWGGSGSRTIINNNFFGAQPFGMSMFGYGMGGCHCNHNRGMSNLFGLMALNSMFGGNQSGGMFGLNFNNMFNPFGNFGNWSNLGTQNNENTNSSLGAKVKSLEDQLASANKKIKDLEAEKAKAEKDKGNEISSSKKAENSTEVGKTQPTEGAGKVQKPTEENTKPADIDKKLDTINGYKDLTADQQKYVKDKIKNQHTDDKGNTTYDISAIVHSGDTIDKVINRFYKPNENHDNTNIPEFGYNTQTSGKKVKNPKVGEEVALNGISDFGLEALVKDAKNEITKESEIQKTNNEMHELLNNFKSGKQKLSKEYVLQNHMMTETAYDKLIKEKY